MMESAATSATLTAHIAVNAGLVAAIGALCTFTLENAPR